MRLIVLCVALLASGLAAASNYRDVSKAVGNDQLLESAGVTPADVQLRAQCSAAVVETDDRPEFFNCVYIQTAKTLELFSLEDGYLISEVQLALPNIDGVAPEAARGRLPILARVGARDELDRRRTGCDDSVRSGFF